MNKSLNATSELNLKTSSISTDTDTDSNHDTNEKDIPYNLSQNMHNILKFFPMPIEPLKKEAIILCPSASETNQNSPIPLTKKTLLSCISTQKTTLILQNILMESSKEVIDTIISQLSGNYRDLIKDKNGNYFCSDLFKICNQEQRIQILKELTQTISDDCVDKYGNHPIQTLIEFSSCEEEYQLILNSFYDFKTLIYASFDSYGSYVIQKIIEHIPEKFRIKFNLLFISFIPLISLKKYGVCSAKKFISFTKNEENIEKIVNIIRKNFVKIATNNFGNFLIQFIIKKWNNTIHGNKLKQEVIFNYKLLSENKYSSYICDLFLKIASKEEKNQLNMLLKFNFINNNNIKFAQIYGQLNIIDNKNANLVNNINSYQSLFSNELTYYTINNNNNKIFDNLIPFSFNRIK